MDPLLWHGLWFHISLMLGLLAHRHMLAEHDEAADERGCIS